MRKIAVTGGLASGKTSVCHLFGKLGGFVVSADQIVHKLLTLNSDIGRAVVDAFGPGVVVGGELDRAAIAEIAFESSENLERLERLLHPAVRRELDLLYQEASQQPHYRFFVAEIPLLFETGMEDLFDTVVVVKADPEVCRHRFGNERQYTKRMQRQISTEEKEKRADFVLSNNGSLEELFHATEAVARLLSTP